MPAPVQAATISVVADAVMAMRRATSPFSATRRRGRPWPAGARPRAGHLVVLELARVCIPDDVRWVDVLVDDALLVDLAQGCRGLDGEVEEPDLA
jgi:hypothetical protein